MTESMGVFMTHSV